MFKKLEIKFTATIMALVTSLVIVLFCFIYIGMKTNNENLIFNDITKSLNSIKPNDRMPEDKERKGEISIIYSNKDSKLIYQSDEDIEEKKILELVQLTLNNKKEKGFINYEGTTYAYMYKYSPIGMDLVLKDSTDYKNIMNRLIIILIIVGVVSLIFLFFVSIFIAKKAIKPVEEAFKAQKQFIADASHELKTPLAIINTNMDLLLVNKEDKIVNQQKWIDYIRFQTDRMAKLINNMLFLAKADNNEQLGVVSKFNISDVIMNQLLTFEAIIYEKDLQLVTDIEENIEFNGDKEAIIRLVGILVDNAIKNSYENTYIKVILQKRKQKIFLSVSNKGDTIEEENIKKIFERFYRVDSARSREKGGYGLGLSIAQSIVKKHNGRIYCESNNNITTFNVEFN